MEMNGGLGSRMYSNLGGVIGLEMPLQNQQPPPQQQQQIQPSQQNPPHHQPPQQPPPPSQMVTSYAAHHELDHHQSQPQLSLKQAAYHYPVPTTKPKHPVSDDDEPYNGNFGGNDDCSGSTEKRKMSPWQRMKWTDNMVRLLIMAVYYIGDEYVASDDHKKKPVGGSNAGGAGSGGGSLQKKGKWKSVSRAMMEKGFYVSPQQCEDKFNDLNKRYKRVNDILGKGTACRVVENQSLLETMDLTPKMKEEVKKLLNSKHLFFREMCAYHNSCGHGNGGGAASGGGNGGGHHSPDGPMTEQSQSHPVPRQQQQQQGQQQQHPPPQDCFHSAQTTLLPKTTNRAMAAESKMVPKVDSDDGDHDEDDDDDDEDEYHDDDDDGHSDDDHIEGPMRKRPRREILFPNQHSAQLISNEIATITQDKTKTPREKKQWILARSMQLEEQGLKYQYEAFEIEKQKLKWMMYCSKKEREMEKMKLQNERKKLENERMLLILRKKELELVEQQNPNSMTG